MSIRLQRFDFDHLRDFRGPVVQPEVQEEVIEPVYVPPPPPTFSEEELAAERDAAAKAGYAKGYEAALRHADEQADIKRINAEKTIASLNVSLEILQHRYQELLNKEATELSSLVLMIARKITGVTLEHFGAEAVSALVQRCLPIILSKPQLIIELNPQSFETTMDHIESLLEKSGFEGQVQFRANPALGAHDAVLDWNAGLATRNTAELWQEIETLLLSMPITLEPLASAPQQPSIDAGLNGPEPAETTTQPIA